MFFFDHTQDELYEKVELLSDEGLHIMYIAASRWTPLTIICKQVPYEDFVFKVTDSKIRQTIVELE